MVLIRPSIKPLPLKWALDRSSTNSCFKEEGWCKLSPVSGVVCDWPFLVEITQGSNAYWDTIKDKIVGPNGVRYRGVPHRAKLPRLLFGTNLQLQNEMFCYNLDLARNVTLNHEEPRLQLRRHFVNAV